ncbi:unnamed protein product [Prunus armeniaca]
MWVRHRGDVGNSTGFVSSSEKFRAGPVKVVMANVHGDGGRARLVYGSFPRTHGGL